MEPKLQQAIVATRAGRVDIAQHLLIQLIDDHPEDPNAWFLLSHLVDSPDRQTMYLNKVLQLDPNHELAYKRIAQLPDSPVPAPVIQGELPDTNVEDGPIDHDIIEEVQITPSTPPIREVSEEFPDETAAAGQPQEWREDLEEIQREEQQQNQALDEDWKKTAGMPKRESSPSNQSDSNPDTANSSKRSRGDTWLIRALLLMVLVAFIVLGFLIILILI